MRTFHRHKWVLQTSSVLWNCLHTFYFCAIVILKFNNENRKMKYDIFISYRREGGYELAKHLNDLLVRDGYKVSFDMDTLRSGDFDTQLLSRIDECKDFIIIVDEHAFDRISDSKYKSKTDWLRSELAYALKRNKNIIPIFYGVNSFSRWNLPNDIVGVTKKNGPEYNKYHFNSFYSILKKRFIHKKNKWISFIFGLIIIAIVVGIVNVIVSNLTKTDSSEDEITKSQKTEIVDTPAQLEKLREEALKSFCGNYSLFAPGLMKEGIPVEFWLKLDPVNHSCKYLCDGLANITHSIGIYGREQQCPEIWEIYRFSLNNNLRSAIVDMRQVDEWYEGENRVCTVKLELDEFNDLKMTFISGNAKPGILYTPSPVLNRKIGNQ